MGKISAMNTREARKLYLLSRKFRSNFNINVSIYCTFFRFLEHSDGLLLLRGFVFLVWGGSLDRIVVAFCIFKSSYKSQGAVLRLQNTN